MSEAVMLVEFFGGPCDGYNMTMQGSSEAMPQAVAIPLNENVYRILNGERRGTPRPCSTVAFYKLADAEEGRYNFIGICSTTELHVQDWQA